MRRIRMLTLAVCALSTAMILELSAVARPQAAQPPSSLLPHRLVPTCLQAARV
jgi:hypothetical protein